MRDNETISDEELVGKVRSIDQELYVLIVDRYQNKLLRYATSLVKDEHKAADIVQDSFIKAFINLQGFNVTKSFSSWIYRIVHNEAMNNVKKYRKEVPLSDDVDFSSDEDIEKNLERKETIEQVVRCLGEIPLLYAEPIELHFIEEKSYEEISDILRIPIGTVATRINRAKILMKTICQSIQK
jgi:RNA polymerase sigma-70 factor (ECF subfamily)